MNVVIMVGQSAQNSCHKDQHVHRKSSAMCNSSSSSGRAALCNAPYGSWIVARSPSKDSSYGEVIEIQPNSLSCPWCGR